MIESVLNSELELVLPVKVNDFVGETGLLDLLLEVRERRHEDIVIADHVSWCCPYCS